jgi:hypothetical protein
VSVSVVVQRIYSNTKAHCGFQVQFQPIKRIVHIRLHSHNISQGMNLLPVEVADVVAESREDSQYGSSIVKLGV